MHIWRKLLDSSSNFGQAYQYYPTTRFLSNLFDNDYLEIARAFGHKRRRIAEFFSDGCHICICSTPNCFRLTEFCLCRLCNNTIIDELHLLTCTYFSDVMATADRILSLWLFSSFLFTFFATANLIHWTLRFTCCFIVFLGDDLTILVCYILFCFHNFFFLPQPWGFLMNSHFPSFLPFRDSGTIWQSPFWQSVRFDKSLFWQNDRFDKVSILTRVRFDNWTLWPIFNFPTMRFLISISPLSLEKISDITFGSSLIP